MASRRVQIALALEVSTSWWPATVPLEIRRLIREMSIANPLWGAPRIHGELLKLGIDIGQTSVAKYMARRRGSPSQGWKTFLHNHADGIVAIDLFVVPTISFRLLYGLLIIGHGRLDRAEVAHIEPAAARFVFPKMLGLAQRRSVHLLADDFSALNGVVPVSHGFRLLLGLIREAERSVNGILPKIISCGVVSFQTSHKLVNRGGRGVGKTVTFGSFFAHRFKERPQCRDRLVGREASRTMQYPQGTGRQLFVAAHASCPRCDSELNSSVIARHRSYTNVRLGSLRGPTGPTGVRPPRRF